MSNSNNFLVKVSIFSLFDNQKNIPWSENMQTKLRYECVNAAGMEHTPNCITCHLTWEKFDQYDSSNLVGYQFVNQEILYFTISSTYSSL
jgi:hypothetical protein